MPIRTFGPLFTKGAVVTPAVAKALADTVEFTKVRLEAETPVRTGRLRSSWQAAGNAITNTAPYAFYVETRRHMVKSTVPQAQKYLLQAVTSEVGKALAATQSKKPLTRPRRHRSINL